MSRLEEFVAISFFGSDFHDFNHQEDIQEKDVLNYLWFAASIIKKRFQSYFYYDCLFFSRDTLHTFVLLLPCVDPSFEL